MSDPLPRILFADQLGPHFDDGGPIVIPEVLSPLRRRVYHRQKAHLILSALRHRAQELGARAEVRRGESYREVLRGVAGSVVNPTSWGLRDLVTDLQRDATLDVLPSRGFVASEEDFQHWAGRQKSRLLMENFYRHQRRSTRILMVPGDGDSPEGGAYNFDHDNRQPPPKNRRHSVSPSRGFRSRARLIATFAHTSMTWNPAERSPSLVMTGRACFPRLGRRPLMPWSISWLIVWPLLVLTRMLRCRETGQCRIRCSAPL